MRFPNKSAFFTAAALTLAAAPIQANPVPGRTIVAAINPDVKIDSTTNLPSQDGKTSEAPPQATARLGSYCSKKSSPQIAGITVGKLHREIVDDKERTGRTVIIVTNGEERFLVDRVFVPVKEDGTFGPGVATRIDPKYPGEFGQSILRAMRKCGIKRNEP